MTTEAQKKAIQKYRQSFAGKEAQKQAQKRYAQTPEGREALARAQEKYRRKNAEELREYKRLKAREYRARNKAEKLVAQGR